MRRVTTQPSFLMDDFVTNKMGGKRYIRVNYRLKLLIIQLMGTIYDHTWSAGVNLDSTQGSFAICFELCFAAFS